EKPGERRPVGAEVLLADAFLQQRGVLPLPDEGRDMTEDVFAEQFLPPAQLLEKGGARSGKFVDVAFENRGGLTQEHLGAEDVSQRAKDGVVFAEVFVKLFD